MDFLEIDHVVMMHDDLIVKFGGVAGIRDEKLLDSALMHPRLLYSLAGESDFHVLAAAYCYHLIKNHSFVDGNKRIGILAMLAFLGMNNIFISQIPNEELYNLAICIASSKVKETLIIKFLKKYSVPKV
jgi:death-on-curing protein